MLFRQDGQQTSATFADAASAENFKNLVDHVGPEMALQKYGVGPTKSQTPASGPTVSVFLTDHIKGLTGVEKKTTVECERPQLVTTGRPLPRFSLRGP